MNTTENIKKLINEINSREPKNYEEMKVDEISKELHKIMEFEQTVLKKIHNTNFHILQ